MRQESVFEDDPVLYADPSRAAEIAALGADTLRLLVRPADDPGPVVAAAEAAGLDVMLVPTGPVRRPQPRAYGRFVRRLGTRFPEVRRWGLWNEPNQPRWLRPQFARRHGRVVLVSARRYRALARAGIGALRATGHGADVILLGETAPIGRTTGRPATRLAAPAPFIRSLLSRGPRLRVTGFAHHPYTSGAGAPVGAPLSPGQISIGNVGTLKRLLARGARRGVIPGGLPIWYTEFGYQTDPPDARLGVSYARQAEYINQADAIAAADPRVAAVSQYQLVDDRDVFGFQTGLRRFGSLARKPSYGAYRMPLWVRRRGRHVSVYGQVRPAQGPISVLLQRAGSAAGPFRVVRTLRVDGPTHQFRARARYRRGVYRLAWQPAPGDPYFVSRTATARGSSRRSGS
jgi:hypothetical protein